MKRGYGSFPCGATNPKKEEELMEPTRNLKALFQPKSVALIGAIGNAGQAGL